MKVSINTIDIADGTATIIYSDGSKSTLAAFAPAPPPPASGIIKGGYFDGILNGDAKSYADKFGMGWVRIWHTIKWDERLGSSHPTFLRCRTLQAAGLKTLVVMTPPEQTAAGPAGSPPASGIAAAYFDAAAIAAGGCVDAWEIWNEPNLSQYNARFGYSDWVKAALIPAYSVLHPRGQFVVSGGWSGTAGPQFQYMIDNGLLTGCDAVGYHPYGSSPADQITKIGDMRHRVGNKPIWLTEWNLHMDKSNPAAWMQSLLDAAKIIADGPLVQAIFHFRMVRNTSSAGVAAPYYLDGTTILPAATFSDGTLAAMKAL
jgi:hypothetical protein